MSAAQNHIELLKNLIAGVAYWLGRRMAGKIFAPRPLIAAAEGAHEVS
jgi:hypothetical protein